MAIETKAVATKSCSGTQFGCFDYRHRTGILLAQLGTPQAPTSRALRRYLRQFLADPRVIEVNRFVWWFILNGIILPFRPSRSAKLYRRIWTDEGSPLLKITEKQTELLKHKLANSYSDIPVTFGMRYGEPSIESAVKELKDAGCDRIVLLPMYPQYAGATTGSTYDALFDAFKKIRWVPTLRVVEPYFAHPAYIRSLAESINRQLSELPHTPEYLVLSFHGIPLAYIDRGDPYCCMCTETTRLLKPLVKFPEDRIIQTFQSRFGRDPWLEPYTDETIKRLGEAGAKRIAVACPGFTADCLETLDEIGNEGLEEFHEAGGDELYSLFCVNTDNTWIEGMFEILADSSRDWLEYKTTKRTSYECPVRVCLREAKKS